MVFDRAQQWEARNADLDLTSSKMIAGGFAEVREGGGRGWGGGVELRWILDAGWVGIRRRFGLGDGG